MSRYYSQRKKEKLDASYKEAVRILGNLKTPRKLRVNGSLTIESIEYKKGIWRLISKESGCWVTTPIEKMYF